MKTKYKYALTGNTPRNASEYVAMAMWEIYSDEAREEYASPDEVRLKISSMSGKVFEISTIKTALRLNSHFSFKMQKSREIYECPHYAMVPTRSHHYRPINKFIFFDSLVHARLLMRLKTPTPTCGIGGFSDETHSRLKIKKTKTKTKSLRYSVDVLKGYIENAEHNLECAKKELKDLMSLIEK